MVWSPGESGKVSEQKPKAEARTPVRGLLSGKVNWPVWSALVPERVPNTCRLAKGMGWSSLPLTTVTETDVWAAKNSGRTKPAIKSKYLGMV